MNDQIKYYLEINQKKEMEIFKLNLELRYKKIEVNILKKSLDEAFDKLAIYSLKDLQKKYNKYK
jgi:hypothetical protein